MMLFVDIRCLYVCVWDLSVTWLLGVIVEIDSG